MFRAVIGLKGEVRCEHGHVILSADPEAMLDLKHDLGPDWIREFYGMWLGAIEAHRSACK